MFSLICGWINNWVNNREDGHWSAIAIIMTSLKCDLATQGTSVYPVDSRAITFDSSSTGFHGATYKSQILYCFHWRRQGETNKRIWGGGGGWGLLVQALKSWLSITPMMKWNKNKHNLFYVREVRSTHKFDIHQLGTVLMVTVTLFALRSTDSLNRFVHCHSACHTEHVVRMLCSNLGAFYAGFPCAEYTAGVGFTYQKKAMN